MNVKFVYLALICLICFGLAIATASNVNYVEIPTKNITSNEKLNEFFNVTSNGSAILSQNDSQSVIPMSEYIYEKIRKEKENNEENPVHSTIYVPDDYPTIQQAVNASSPGYTIIVRDGVYTENVVVNVEHLTIKSENGYANCIVKAASKEKPVFYIKSDYVNVTGFSVTGGSDGVDITSKNCTIAKNNISRNSLGVRIGYYDIISILFKATERNLVINNKIINNKEGVLLFHANKNVIADNSIINNTGTGISLYSADKNIIANNRVIKNKEGINIHGSSQNNILTNNTMSNNEINLKFSSEKKQLLL